MPELINEARVDATFDTTEMYDLSTVTVDIPSIQITKSASMAVWHGDVLTYTILVENLDAAIEATAAKFSDTIDPVLAVLDTESVYVDGQKKTLNTDFTYSPSTGVLEIDPLPNVPAGGEYEITFRVTKV